jgi:endonuclease/exonuclease/phosphatase family metal-dependent hydrolase
MRLITWNCSWGKSGEKREAILALEPDIVVLQELRREAPDSSTYRWYGGDPKKKGITVIARNGYELAPVRKRPSVPRWVVPVQVSGPRSFLMLAVWTTNYEHRYRYVRGLNRALDLYRGVIAQHESTVVLGDFNANVIWDAEHPEGQSQGALNEKLSALGLTSAYHTYFREKHGKETRHTHYFYHHEHRPYHIDYCFVPRAWGRPKKVSVGSYADWRPMSDHCPLVVDVAPLSHPE